MENTIINNIDVIDVNDINIQPKRKMRQDYLFLYILKLCFK